MGHCGDDKWKLDKCRFDWCAKVALLFIFTVGLSTSSFFLFSF